MIDELPGLLGSGFRPTGKYGIGFFSIFMLGNSVRVRTRRADAAQKDTLVLEFNTGLGSRPVLREAASDEVLRDGGTIVRVWLHTPPTEKGGLLWRFGDTPPVPLEQLCCEVCPALPVSLTCDQSNSCIQVLTSSDWINCSGEELFSRTSNQMDYDNESFKDCGEFLAKAAKNLRILKDSDGQPIGRACIGLDENSSRNSSSITALRGAVTIGGLKASNLYGIAGLLAGKSERAARDYATPIVSGDALAAWATEQASLVSCLYDNPDDQMECAEIIRRCGGQLGNLPIAKYKGKYVCSDDIKAMILPNEILLVSPYGVKDLEYLKGFEFVPGVFITQANSWRSILQANHFSGWPDNLFTRWGNIMSVATTLGGSVIEAIAVCWNCPLEQLAIQATDRERSRNERSIGALEGQVIKRDALILTKPNNLTINKTEA